MGERLSLRASSFKLTGCWEERARGVSAARFFLIWRGTRGSFAQSICARKRRRPHRPRWHNVLVTSIAQITAQEHLRRIRKIQTITIAWMLVEAAVSLFASWRAHSPALLAFGGDSAIELLSAMVVLWRFRAGTIHEHAERRAARIAGGLLLALAVYVVAAALATLLGYGEPKPSLLGIAIVTVAAMMMPWLAREKRRLSAATGSAALRADAAQSGVCAYLAVIALIGLTVNAIWQVRWADPVAALAIVPLIVWEARQALRGQPCSC